MPEVSRHADEVVEVGRDWLTRLKAAASESALRRAMVYLHMSDEATVLERILVLCQDVSLRPYRRLDKAASFHIVEGELDLIIFDANGEPLRKVRLGPAGSGNSFYYRLGASLYHTLVPRTPFVVLHETTAGPFRSNETQFAAWAPEDPVDLRGFLEQAASKAQRSHPGGSVTTREFSTQGSVPVEMSGASSVRSHSMPVHRNTLPQHPERVVILGADGFLGRALRQRLAQDTIDTLPITSHVIDLSAANAGQALAAVLRPTDSILVLATVKSGSQLDEPALTANLAIGAALCEAVRAVGCRHLVYVSSDAVYPFGSVPVREELAPMAPSLYGRMHLAREHMLRQIDGLPLSILRLTQVYGSGDPHNAYGPNRMIRSALTAGRISLYGTGEETRDHIHIRDIAKLLFDVLAMRTVGVMNVATGRSVSFAHVAELVRRCCGGEIAHDPRRVPVTHRVFDTSALEAAFPGRTWTVLESGIAITARSEATALGIPDTPRAGNGAAAHHGAVFDASVPDGESR